MPDPVKIQMPITVVTGLPRSGTSLLMQMLAAGGMQLLTDDLRQADEQNERGYFEYEPVKRIETDASWLHLAQGKVVKIVVPLVKVVVDQAVPAVVLLMKRDMDSVLRSQRRMAEMAGVLVTDAEQAQLAEVFEREVRETIRLIEANPQQSLLEVQYEDVLAGPLQIANQIARVLPACVDASAMASVVDRRLDHSTLR